MLPMLSFRYFRIKDSKHRKLNFKDLQSPRILVQAMEWSVLVFGTKYCTMRDIPENISVSKYYIGETILKKFCSDHVDIIDSIHSTT